MRVPTKLLGILAVIIIMATATGCDSGNGGNHQALTENDFVNNPSLRAVPDNQIIVDFLEPPSSDTPQYDTGEVGIDLIPLTYPQTETDTFCWKDANSGDMDYMVLLDSQGEEVLRVDVNGDCVTDTIDPGDYVMEFHHDGSTDPHTIFMGPKGGPDQQAMKTDGLFNGFKVVVSKILRGIQNTIFKDARAQATTKANLVAYILDTNECDSCDLRNIIAPVAFFHYVNLSYSDLAYAHLELAILRQSTLINTYFGGAYLHSATFDEADLTGAFLPKTVSTLIGACPSFSQAKWCNGRCTCNRLSECGCTGCGSVTTACRTDNSCRTQSRGCDGPR